jgi:hypothetical protein
LLDRGGNRSVAPPKPYTVVIPYCQGEFTECTPGCIRLFYRYET